MNSTKMFALIITAFITSLLVPLACIEADFCSSDRTCFAERADSLVSDQTAAHNLQCNMSDLMQSENFLDNINWKNNFSKFSIGNCNLNGINAQMARRCIAQNSPRGIALIGDSLTRYQYLNLIYFLVHDTWKANDDSLPNENEKSFQSWTQFYQITNQRMNGHEICDCYRKSTLDFLDSTMENRYFHHGDVKVSYRMVFGDQSNIRMHDTELLNVSSCGGSGCCQGLCPPGKCSPSISPVSDFGTILQPGAFQSLAESHPASDIFFNAGLWWVREGQNGFEDHGQLLLEEARRFREAGSTARLHWKTTTAAKGRFRMAPELSLARGLTGAAGGFDAVYDAHAITADIPDAAAWLMWDDVHFDSSVYEALNRALVAYVCSLPPGR